MNPLALPNLASGAPASVLLLSIRPMFDRNRVAHLESRLKGCIAWTQRDKAWKIFANSIMPLADVIDFC